MRTGRLPGILTILFTASVSFSAECPPIGGIEPLLKAGKMVLLGELHGTQEAPAFALDVACHAAKAGIPVVVGLELSTAERGRVQTFLNSEGNATDTAALLAGNLWQRDYQDGRNSRAMVGLIENMRQLREQGRGVGVVFYDAPAGRGAQDREVRMAAALATSMNAHPESVHVVLTGNLHSRVAPGVPRNKDYEPMGYLLAQRVAAKRLLAFDVAHEGGTAWICSPECGVAQLGRAPNAARGQRR